MVQTNPLMRTHLRTHHTLGARKLQLCRATSRPQPGRLALKEWAVTIAALGEGEQTVGNSMQKINQLHFWSPEWGVEKVVCIPLDVVAIGVCDDFLQILARKGGIREVRFDPRHSSFYLLPTSFHADPALVQSRASEYFQKVEYSLSLIYQGGIWTL